MTKPSDNKQRKKKRTWLVVDFAFLTDPKVKLKESEKRGKFLDLVRQMKKNVEQECDGDTNWNWCARFSQ